MGRPLLSLAEKDNRANDQTYLDAFLTAEIRAQALHGNVNLQ